MAGRRPQEWACEHGLLRYFAKSIKGTAEIDWSSRTAREEFLGGLVTDAERLLELARQAHSELEEGSKDERRLPAASQLLSQLLLQDVERKHWAMLPMAARAPGVCLASAWRQSTACASLSACSVAGAVMNMISSSQPVALNSSTRSFAWAGVFTAAAQIRGPHAP